MSHSFPTNSSSAAESGANPPADGPAAAALRQAAAAAGDVMDAAVLAAVRRLWAESSPADLAAGAPEYSREEFLLVLDGGGHPARLAEDLAGAVAAWLEQEPAARAWLRLTGGEQGLLAARWLCHLAGLRHAAVELLLTHPARPRTLLLQARARAKVIAPGCLDLPVAGHVDGLQTALETLRREADEELALDLDRHTRGLREIGSVLARESELRGRSGALLVDSEYRVVYAAELDPAAWPDLHPDPAEVAGLALYALDWLRESAGAQPERFASGIRAALPLILRHCGAES